LNYSKIKKPPRLSGTPPKEGKLHVFPSFGGVPNGRGGHYVFLMNKFYYEFEYPSPDSNGNPLWFFFKTIKIEVNSRKKLLKKN